MADANLIQWIYNKFLAGGGEQRRLYCSSCKKITNQVAITEGEFLEIHSESEEGFAWLVSKAGSLGFSIPLFGDFSRAFSRLLQGRPFYCETCGNMKLER